jgi:hypothetical protein
MPRGQAVAEAVSLPVLACMLVQLFAPTSRNSTCMPRGQAAAEAVSVSVLVCMLVQLF